MWGIRLVTSPNHSSDYMQMVECCLYPAAFLSAQPELSLVQLPSANMFLTSHQMHSSALKL